MNKLAEFLKKPRNIYFSIIAMLTVVTGLVSISFSYYIDDSTNSNIIEVSKVDNRIQSDELIQGYITIPAQETKEITVYIMSNNDFDSKFKLYYKTDDNVEVLSESEMDDQISSHDVLEYKLIISNYDEKESEVFIGIANGYIGKTIELEGKEIGVY